MVAQAIASILVAFLALVASFGAGAEDDPAAQAQRAIESAANDPTFLEGVRTPEHPDIAGVRAELANLRASLAGPPLPTGTPDVTAVDTTPSIRFRLFVSQRQPANELRAAAALASQHRDLVLVFRGFLPGQTAGGFGDRILELMKGLTPRPAVDLDPERFSADGVDAVPTLIAYDSANVATARVSGAMNPEVLAGATGDQGKRGTTYDIGEEDLIVAMKAALAAVDFNALKAKAVDRFWQQQDFVELPTAVEERTRIVDPTFEVATTIVTPSGTVIAREGDRVNPLERMPFSLRLIAFDPLSETQRTVVRDLIARTPSNRRTVLMVTRLARASAFDDLAALGKDFKQPVYLLTREVAETFQIERVPAYVEASGLVFKITEVPSTESAGSTPQ